MVELSPFDWQQVVIRVRQVWGTGKLSESWDKAETLYRRDQRIQQLPKESVMAAIGSYEHEGRTFAPAIPSVLTRASGATWQAERPDPETCTHPDDSVSQLGDIEICAICLSEWISRDLPPGHTGQPACADCGDTKYVYSEGRLYPCRHCEDAEVGIE